MFTSEVFDITPEFAELSLYIQQPAAHRAVASPSMFFIPPSRPGWLLGYGGLTPFMGLAAASWFLPAPHQAQALFAVLAYGATILSFLGAIHWGLTLRDPVTPSAGLLVWGVVPSLLAWVALLLDTRLGLLLLAAALWICLAVDWRVYPRMGLRGWLGFRLALTTLASLSCLFAAFAVAH